MRTNHTEVEALANSVIENKRLRLFTERALAQGVLDLLAENLELDKAYHVWKAKHRKREAEIDKLTEEITRLKREVNHLTERVDAHADWWPLTPKPYPEVEEA